MSKRFPLGTFTPDQLAAINAFYEAVLNCADKITLMRNNNAVGSTSEALEIVHRYVNRVRPDPYHHSPIVRKLS